MEAILSECVQTSLRSFLYGNAIFMCHRLCAESPSETNLQLLAVCYLSNNQPFSAYHVLKGRSTAQSRYLFAQSCFKMDLLAEAEKALCPPNEASVEVPNGAAGHYLLGLIYRYTDRRKCAIQHFRQALTLDPLLWAAYEELCTLGAAEEAAVVFGDDVSLCVQNQYLLSGSAMRSLQPSTENHGLNTSKNLGSEDLSPEHVMHIQSSQQDVSAYYQGLPQSDGVVNQPFNVVSTNASFYSTPSPMATTTQFSAVAPPPLCRNGQINGPNLGAYGVDGSPRSTVNPILQAPRRKFVDGGKLRKVSGRLFTDSGPRRSLRLTSGEAVTNMNSSAATGNDHSSRYIGRSKLSIASLHTVTGRKGQSYGNENSDEVSGTKNDVYDGTHIISTTSSPPGDESRLLEQEGLTMFAAGALDILALLRILGEGYRLFCVYRCQEALDIFMKLSQKQYNTGWVLTQVGKSYFEMVNYTEADRAFSLARLTCPHSLEGMDIYSTVLYHLKEDMKLSYLAQELISIDRLAPQSWIALGNCYSLQKDHETALKNFQRALQLDLRFAYAHTLCGHEYVALEDYENGIKCYQSALRVDDRHYNAWYGLGMVYLRQEKLEFSEHHFRRAFQINSRSSVIMSYLGIALQALKRSNEALMVMEKAVLADQKNPLPLYQKAVILVSMDNLDGALKVLEELTECVPRESSVYALMGRIYRKRNIYDKAMLYFGRALDMKPSTADAAIIKAAIEKLHTPDEFADDF